MDPPQGGGPGDLAQSMNNLAAQVNNLALTRNIEKVNEIITPFSGETKCFAEWIKQIDKYAKLVELPEPDKRRVAFQTARGYVSDFISRSLAINPNKTWQELYNELSSYFSEVADSQHAMSLLRQCRQGSTEPLVVYSERLIELCLKAFITQERFNQNQHFAVGYFIDGLLDQSTKMRLMRQNPPDLQSAIEIALTELNLAKRFQLRQVTEPTPMDIDRVRRKPRCFKCGREGHKSRDCRTVNNVESNSGERLCWACGGKGHYKRECPTRRNRGREREQNQFGQQARAGQQQNQFGQHQSRQQHF